MSYCPAVAAQCLGSSTVKTGGCSTVRWSSQLSRGAKSCAIGSLHRLVERGLMKGIVLSAASAAALPRRGRPTSSCCRSTQADGYYPLTTLMLAAVRDPAGLHPAARLPIAAFRDGKQWGVDIRTPTSQAGGTRGLRVAAIRRKDRVGLIWPTIFLGYSLRRWPSWRHRHGRGIDAYW